MASPRELLLIRHAKSSWAEPELPDADRPLSARGIRSARDLAERIAGERLSPRLVLCSPSRRTRETLAALLPVLVAPVTLELDPLLYPGAVDAVLVRLRSVEPSIARVAVIGHNPWVEELVALLAPDGAPPAMPTAALAVLRVDGTWADLDAGGATFVACYLQDGRSPE